jgi:quercetin 2,3-dioxygenase
MIRIRQAHSRGHASFGWLDTWHTFSFGQYYDPAYQGFGTLRVINDDRIAAGAGFPMHGHEDMEIVTYVVEGALEHRDSLNNHGVIKAGEVQRMRAGTGIRHSEYNASSVDGVHLLQIWILPDEKGLEPGYRQIRPDPAGQAGRFQLVASPDGREDSVDIHQDASIYAARLARGDKILQPLPQGRKAYLQIVRGSLLLNDQLLHAGDGAAITGENHLSLAALENATEYAEVLLFDLQ